MTDFVIDEDLPRSTARALAAADHCVKDIRDHGLRGADDEKIFRFAQENHAVLLTADLGFGNPLRFPPGRHYGIVIARFPNEMSTKEMNRLLVRELARLSDNDYRGNIVIIEPGQVRIRRQ